MSTPRRVRYFGVGNESWGCGGNMRPEFYADLFRRYNTFAAPDAVTPAASDGVRLAGNTLEVSLAPMSVVVIELR